MASIWNAICVILHMSQLQVPWWKSAQLLIFFNNLCSRSNAKSILEMMILLLAMLHRTKLSGILRWCVLWNCLCLRPLGSGSVWNVSLNPSSWRKFEVQKWNGIFSLQKRRRHFRRQSRQRWTNGFKQKLSRGQWDQFQKGELCKHGGCSPTRRAAHQKLE